MSAGALSGGVSGRQLKLSPQAQELPALGLSMVKPCFSMVSAKSMRGALEVGGAHPVDDDLDTVEVAHEVTVEGALVEVELVDQAGAAAGLDADAKAQVVATLLLEQALDLAGGDVGEDDAVGGSLGPSGVGASVVWS